MESFGREDFEFDALVRTSQSNPLDWEAGARHRNGGVVYSSELGNGRAVAEAKEMAENAREECKKSLKRSRSAGSESSVGRKRLSNRVSAKASRVCQMVYMEKLEELLHIYEDKYKRLYKTQQDLQDEINQLRNRNELLQLKLNYMSLQSNALVQATQPPRVHYPLAQCVPNESYEHLNASEFDLYAELAHISVSEQASPNHAV
eukprot:CAMPEP_0182448076 /NCGR_PEP_ID=MMETSP1172-20130603/23297_1 /TAXON_ID=708627 /ORGANISM="Timspurckia oligopyrenoides, Strain CCMP3278" /LENGTH=203 /DNA_ID=CAMNT_0024644797 /DNA_START=327 /DNA_END=938 /DNA_ORIENTATION=+